MMKGAVERGRALRARVVGAPAKRRGAGRHPRRLAVEGLEDRCLLTAVLSEFPIAPPGGAPIDVVRAGDGGLWFTLPNHIGRLHADGQNFEQYPIPTHNSGPGAITVGPDGNPWFLQTTTNAVAKLDATTGQITEYPILTRVNAGLQGITSAGGALWFTMTTANAIGRLDPATGAITEIAAFQHSRPYGITTDHNGAVWFTMQGTNQISRVDTTSLEIDVPYEVATGDAGIRGIAANPQDRRLYFTLNRANMIGAFDPATRIVSTYSQGISPNAELDRIIAAENGRLYFTEPNAQRVVMLNPETTQGIVRGLVVNSVQQRPNALAFGPGDGLFFTGPNQGRLGRLNPLNMTQAATAVNYDSPGIGYPAGMVWGPDGALWYLLTDSGAIGRFDPVTRFREQFRLNLPSGMGIGYTMIVGPDDKFYFNLSGGSIAQFDPQSKTLRTFRTASTNPGVTGMVFDPDPNKPNVLWYVARRENAVGRIDLTREHSVEYPLTTANAGANMIAATPDRFLWVTQDNARLISRVDSETGLVTANYPMNNLGAPEDIQYNPVDQRLWFGLGYGINAIGRFDPANTTVAPERIWLPSYRPSSSIPSKVKTLRIGSDGKVWINQQPDGGPDLYLNMIDPNVNPGEYAQYFFQSEVTSLAVAPDGNVWATMSGFANLNIPAHIGVMTNSRALKPTAVEFVVAPTNVRAGSGFGLIVEARNADGQPAPYFTGTVTLTLANNPTGATLRAPAGLTLTEEVRNGRAVFAGLTLDRAGSGYTIRATATAASPTTVSFTTVTPPIEVAETATQLVFTPPLAGDIEAGATFTAIVSARDSAGRVDPIFDRPITINLGSNPSGGSLVGTRTVRPVNGVARFDGLSIARAGTYTVRATAAGLPTLDSSPFRVVPGQATSFDVTTDRSSTVAGDPFSITVRALDLYGNVATGFGGTVRFSTDIPQPNLPPDYAFQPADRGEKSFSPLRLTTAGQRTITVDGGSARGQRTIQVTPAETTALVLNVPSSATAGVPVTLTLRAQDAFGNTTPAYRGRVQFRSPTDALATMPSDHTFTAANNGSHTFQARLRTAGAQTITVVDTASAGLTSNATTTVALNGTTTTLLPLPTGLVYGNSFRPRAEVRAVVPGGDPLTGTVRFTLNGQPIGDPVSIANGVAIGPEVAGLAAGTFTMTAAYSNDPLTMPSESVRVTREVAKAPLTIAAANTSRTYGAPNPEFGLTYAGFVNGEGPSVLAGSPAFQTVAGPQSHVGSYTVTPSGLTSTNYDIRFAPGTLTVTPAPLTVAAANTSRTYGAPNPAFGLTFAGFVNGEGPSVLAGSPAFQTVAGPRSHVGSYDVTPSGLTSPNRNYQIRFAPGTLTITPAPLTIRAEDRTWYRNSPAPVLTAVYSGFMNGEGPANLTSPPTLTTDAQASSPVGTYTILVSGGASPNYAITPVPGTLTMIAALATPRAVTPTPARGQVTGLEITFSEPLDAASASRLANYRLTTAGRDGVFGTRDDVTVALRSVRYNATTRTVTLAIRARLSPTATHQLQVSGLLDTLARPFDGDRNGTPGGNLLIRLRNRTVTFQ